MLLEVVAYLRFTDIPTMDWPSINPDMNPVEHIWDALILSARRNVLAHMNFRELKQLVLVKWENIPQETIRNLINNMPRRMEALIRVRGGSTHNTIQILTISFYLNFLSSFSTPFSLHLALLFLSFINIFPDNTTPIFQTLAEII